MAETDILQKLNQAFTALSQERKSIVVPLAEMIQKVGLDKKQSSKYEQILKSSGNFKLDYKKEGILVNRKIFKPMEKTMTTPQNTTNNNVKLHDRIKALRDALSGGLYEKDEAVRLALLTAIAGESIFFLGNPGGAKSMIARRIVKAFKADGDDKIKYFETLLNAYTTPDEIFGNVSLKGLNGDLPEYPNKEVYRRLTENMLPKADIAFLDEIWKANSTILNSLLTIVNERKFHNGNEIEDVPLKALFTASNELPAKGQGLEALYDRLILRLIVSFIDDEDNFFDMVDSPSSLEFELPEEVKKLQISNAELKEWKKIIDEISLSDAAKSVISAIRKELASRNDAMSEEDKESGELFEVGDRRWKKIVHILKTSAFLNDRTEIDLMDCQLIEYCIWSTKKQQKVAREIVEKCIQQNGLDCDTAIDEIKEQIEKFDSVITKRFFIEAEEKPMKYVMNDGLQAYKIKNPQNIYFADHNVKPFYVCNDFTWKGCNDRQGMLYDSNKNPLGSSANFSFSSFKIEQDTVSWTDFWRNWNGYSDSSYSMKIETTTGGFQKDPYLFAPDKENNLHAIQNEVDQSNYQPITDLIFSEIKKLDNFAKEQTAPYRANLFADQHYCDVIMNTVTEAKRDLQNAQVDLDKKRSRYQD
ncbi:AAA family ATPase [uncultured Fibrobacter sp.]|uniref:AAA family ATPase n=1 Tax=uncultured Fibrobacter sp. TaxID=261512 RepID=UPI00261C2C86|nr:AAA family ATPase [uncultured Fibrobacter sp.]